MAKKKIFVLDTNVILHDWKCIYSFKEHDIKIPSIVLEELDTFKKNGGARGFNARSFIRELNTLRVNSTKKGTIIPSKLANGGVSLGDGLGTIATIQLNDTNKVVYDAFEKKNPDNVIISLSYNLKQEYPDRDVIFVSKDTNALLKSDVLNVLAEEYKNDQLKEIDNIYAGRFVVENEKMDDIINLLHKHGEVSYQKVLKFLGLDLVDNMYLVLKTLNSNALVRVNTKERVFVNLKKRTIFGIKPKNSEQIFAMDAVLNEKSKLITLFGPAGTGKTLMAIVSALQLMKTKKHKRIIISAAIIPVGNRDLGFLPGDVIEKVSPFMRGLLDNLEFIKEHAKKNGDQGYIEIFNENNGDTKNKKAIKIQPLSSIRGRSINDTVFIIDEAQNLTRHEIKTAITRAGENTKVVLCGDIEQIDAPYLGRSDNGLAHVIFGFKGEPIYSNVNLIKGERSDLATKASKIL